MGKLKKKSQRKKGSKTIFDFREERNKVILKYINEGVKETWKPIIFNGKELPYEISNLSRCRLKHPKGKNNKTYVQPDPRFEIKDGELQFLIWYQDVNIGQGNVSTKKKMELFDLVADAFIERPDDDHEYVVEILDPSKPCDTTSFNLKWVQLKTENEHEHKERQENNDMVREICFYLEKGLPVADISFLVPCDQTLVDAILSGAEYYNIARKYQIFDRLDAQKRFQRDRDALLSYMID